MKHLRESKADFASVYDLHAPMLYRLALSYMGSREDAEDVVQDVFVKLIKADEHFSDDDHMRAWLIRVTVNQCHDHLRRNKLRHYTPLDDLEEQVHEEKEALPEIYSVIQKLPERYRVCLTLHYLEGYAVEEVARMLRLTQSAVKMRLSRGRAALKDLLEKEERHV